MFELRRGAQGRYGGLGNSCRGLNSPGSSSSARMWSSVKSQLIAKQLVDMIFSTCLTTRDDGRRRYGSIECRNWPLGAATAAAARSL